MILFSHEKRVHCVNETISMLKSSLFYFRSSQVFCLHIFFFLNIAPICSCYYLTLLCCNENFIKQKFFIPVGSLCSVCIKNIHVLVREMSRRRRLKGTRKCCISYFCSVCSLNSQIKRSTSKAKRRKLEGKIFL